MKLPAIKPRNPHYRDLMVLKSKIIKQKRGKGSYNRKPRKRVAGE